MNTPPAGRTISLTRPAYILSHAAVGGRQEGLGPLAPWFDHLCDDSFFGEKTWEKAESTMQKTALTLALEKAALQPEDLTFVLAGDLLNQCIGTSFGLRSFRIPFFGLYGACSTMGESLALGSLLVTGGFARRVGAMTSRTSGLLLLDLLYLGVAKHDPDRTEKSLLETRELIRSLQKK